MLHSRPEQSRHPHAASKLNRGLCGGRAPQRPLDHWPPDPQVDEVLITWLARTTELQRQILRIGPRVDKRTENIRRPILQQPPSARQESMGLK
jgi:hypothetical protein